MVEGTPLGTEGGRQAAGLLIDRLAGRRVLLTGVTGFLGQVVFERLLRDFPDTAITLLVRGQPSQTGRARVEYLLRKPAFGPLRARMGEIGILRALDDRVTVVEADFSKDVPEL